MLFALQYAGIGIVSANQMSSGGSFTSAMSDSLLHKVKRPSLTRQAQFSQSQSRSLRSRSEVIRDVKSRYNAEVLKVTLSQNSRFYNVRVLMPNGKVKNIQVSAER